MKSSVIRLVLDAGFVVKLILLLFLFLSVWTWAIAFFKQKHFLKIKKENPKFFNTYRMNKSIESIYWQVKDFVISPFANVFTNVYRAIYMEKTHQHKNEIKNLIKRCEVIELTKLEKYLNFLATVGSTAPFVGLFGTVWGIMNAFRSIGASGAASIAVVAPGIAEALIATAAGLAVSIPAVIFYNHYTGMIRNVGVELENFSEELLDSFTRESNEIT